MQRRMERSGDPLDEEIPKTTRTKKNQYLYDDINTKIGYEEIVSLDTQTRIDLSNLTGISTNKREFHKVEKYQKSLDNEIVNQDEPQEPKVFDINNILQEARDNRIERDELEKKRRIKNKEYLNIEELNKKKAEKVEIDEEDLKELIDQINTRDLSKDIEEADNKDLLEDLIATSKIDAETEIEIDESTDDNSQEEPNYEKKKIINSFYTSSMELSKGDFEEGDALDEDEKPRSKLLIFLIIVLIIGILAAGYLFLKKEGLI